MALRWSLTGRRRRRAAERARAEADARAAALADRQPVSLRRAPARVVRTGEIARPLRRNGAGAFAPVLVGLAFGIGGGVVYGLLTHLTL